MLSIPTTPPVGINFLSDRPHLPVPLNGLMGPRSDLAYLSARMVSNVKKLHSKRSAFAPFMAARGFVYLTAVVDVFSRRVLAHRTAITLCLWLLLWGRGGDCRLVRYISDYGKS